MQTQEFELEVGDSLICDGLRLTVVDIDGDMLVVKVTRIDCRPLDPEEFPDWSPQKDYTALPR